MPRIAPRATTSRCMTGYHSPQVDVEVRLNTNESPYAAAAGVHRRARRRGGALRLEPLPRPLGAGAAARHRQAARGGARAGVRRQRLERGAPDAAASPTAGPAGRPPSSSPPTRCTPTSPASPAPGSSSASGPPTSRSTTPRSTGCSRRRRRSSFLCSPNNPTGRVESRRRWSASSSRRRASSSSTRRTASSPTVPRSTSSTPTGSLVVTRTYSKTWSMAGAAPRLPRRARVVGGRARQGRPALPPRPVQAGRRSGGPALRRRDGGAGRHASGRAGPPGGAARGDLDVDVMAVGRQLRAVPAACAATRTRCGSDWSTARCWCATARRGPAWKAACGSPSARPTKTTDSCPPSRRPWHHEPSPARRHAAAPPPRPTSRSRSTWTARRAPSRCRRGCRSSTTCSTSSAGTAAST